MATKKTTSDLKGTNKKTSSGTRSASTKKTGAGSKTANRTTGGTRSRATSKSPSVEDIRNKAGEIYLDRISRGEPGNAEDDWLKAEEMLKGKK